MEKEPINQHSQVNSEQSNEGGGVSMSPPAFQLKSSSSVGGNDDEGNHGGVSQQNTSLAPPPFQLQANQPIQRNPDPVATKTHKVAEGQLPEDIAEMYGVTVTALKEANANLWQAWTSTIQGFNAGATIAIPAAAPNTSNEVSNPAPVVADKPTTTVANTVNTTTTTTDIAAETDTERKKDKLDRVMLIHSSKDNAFAYSRWELSGEGKESKYATAFEEKIGAELKKEFGKEITREEVLKMIQDAKDKSDFDKAEDYRKKLFRANQYAMVEALDVDKTTASGKVEGKDSLGRTFTSSANHELYGKTKHLNAKGNWVHSTYCNIYAHDLATGLGAYVPRLWWQKAYEDKAIEAMKANKTFDTKVVYGKSITEEMSANKLNAWFPRVGKEYFGWRKATDMEEAQNEANNGKVVVLSAARKGTGSGHISVILAEREEHKAARENDKVTSPLTSQAGSSNHKYKAGSQWWNNSSHKDGGAWIHDGEVDSPLLTPEQLGVADSGKSTKENSETTTTTNDKENTVNPALVNPETNDPAIDANPAENVAVNPVGNETVNENAPESKPKDDNTLVISRGIMMMATEGGFGGDSNDVRKPHFPENLAFYRPYTAAELAAIAKLPGNKRPQRFVKRNSDSVKLSSTGTYKRTKLLGRHTPGDYSKQAPAGHIIATGPNNSGPTIGFGFDIGARFAIGQEAKAKKDLLQAGVGEETATKLSKGAGLRGMAAGKFAATHRSAGMQISANQAVNLLSVAIPSYEANYTPGVVHAAIEEVMVKINYWKGNGGGKKYVKAIFDAAKDKEGIAQFDAAIAQLKTFSGKTFQVGVKYLQIVKNHIAGGGDVEITTAVKSADDLTNGNNDTFAVIKEATKTDKHAGKDLQKSLTGNPLSEDSGLSSAGANEVKPATSSPTSATATSGNSAPAQGLFLSKSVGDGGVNDPVDVLKTKTLLYKGGYDVSLNTAADKKFIAALYKFQDDQKFSFVHDGKVEPGKTTEKALFALQNATRKPAVIKAPTVSNKARIKAQFDKYSKGEIGMPALARAVKPFATSNGAEIIALIAKLPSSSRDNFSYALASNSTNTELAGFNRSLLANMSEQLSTWLTFSGTENTIQKARVDKAMSSGSAKAAGGTLTKAMGKTVKKPAPGYTYGPYLASSDFVSQADPAQYKNVPTLKASELNASSYGVACYDACVAMVKRKGMTVHSNKRIATMLDLKENGDTTVPAGALKSGMTQIDALLATGAAVIVGVDKSAGKSEYNGHTQTNTTASKGRATDHWVVVHAKGTDASGNTFYEFFDPGRYNTPAGTSKNNRLVVNNSTKEAVDSETYSGLTYKMSDVLY